MVKSSGLQIKKPKTKKNPEIMEQMVKGRKIYKNKRWVLYWGKQEDEGKKVVGEEGHGRKGVVL